MSIANPPGLKMAMPFVNLRQEASLESNVWPLVSDRPEGGTLTGHDPRHAIPDQPDSPAATEVAKPHPVSGPAVPDERPRLRMALAATFTLEPVEPAIAFWLNELGYAAEIEFAPYNQVLQQLLDPTSALAKNGELNVVAVRFEDFLRFAPKTGTGRSAPSGARAEKVELQQRPEQVIKQAANELLAALEGFAARSATPTLIWVGPASQQAQDEHGPLFERLSQELAALCDRISHLYWLSSDELARYPVATVYDARRDAIGHIPYTPDYFTALATSIARRLYAIKAPPIKVIAVDCDNTLWKGVVGEEGPHGISFPPGKLALQHALIRQQALGAVIVLVSKNVEDDVGAVFRERPDMPLRPEHIVAQRVNWLPKSLNVAELAAELNVGIDSFLFIDDNPVECAEMKAAHPQVTTLLLPEDEQVASFLDNLWVFDRFKVTEEDQKRTLMYQQNRARTELQQKTGSIGEFLRTLELNVDIALPDQEQLGRVSQLTQRTNQFNFTTQRRNDAEVAQLSRANLECLRVNVTDRFGDYGLVGVMIFGAQGDALRIDTLLLSCRVLGRGVEHRMLAHLGELAKQRGLARVEAPFIASKKNQPAFNFLESLAATKQTAGDATVYSLSAEAATQARYQPGEDATQQLELARTGGSKAKTEAASSKAIDRSRLMQRLSCELTSVLRIQSELARNARSSRPQLDVAYVAPRSETEAQLATIWQRLLHLDQVGVHDDFQALGGTSLLAAELFVAIEEQLGIKLPMTTILEASTISLLEQALLAPRSAHRNTLLRLREGAAGGPQLFLVHDGDGETLLYMNLARRLPADVTVWGLSPLSGSGCPVLHTRMVDMATFYVEQLRKVQPTGPYYLGGMCAGGTIAFEMALQLERDGQQVALVALIDSADAKAPRKVAQVSQDRLRRFFVTVTNGITPGAAEQAAALAAPVSAASADDSSSQPVGRLESAVRKISNLVQYETTKLGKSALDELRFRLLQRAIDKQQAIPEWVSELSVRAIYERLERDYTPQGQLLGQAVLYRATWADAADQPLTAVFRDPQLGWRRRMASGSLALCDVPGGHSSILQEPQVETMADDLALRLATGAQTGDHRHGSSPSRAPDRAHGEPPAQV